MAGAAVAVVGFRSLDPMEMPHGKSLLALGAGPEADKVGLPALAFLLEEDEAEAVGAERMAFAVLPHRVETERGFGLAATAAGLRGGAFHVG